MGCLGHISIDGHCAKIRKLGQKVLTGLLRCIPSPWTGNVTVVIMFIITRPMLSQDYNYPVPENQSLFNPIALYLMDRYVPHWAASSVRAFPQVPYFQKSCESVGCVVLDPCTFGKGRVTQDTVHASTEKGAGLYMGT
jgi:hypothetical protein